MKKAVKPSKIRITKAMKAVFSRMGKRGGAARAASLTFAERREIGKKAIAVRWAKVRAKEARRKPAPKAS